MNNRFRMLLVTVSLIVATALAVDGCGKKKEIKGDTEPKRAVIGYCGAVAETYKTLDAGLMAGHASEREIGRIGMIIMKFQGEKKFMESELLEIRFVKAVEKEKDAAEVETWEKWRLRHLSKDSREVVKPWTQEEYKLKYELVREGRKWLVHKTVFLK